ncbi:FtsX-like permease family protein [compost metagenome]
MIRPADVVVLAYTKLRTRKIRTAITIAVAGILFGFLVLLVLVAQGVLDSTKRFSGEGLNNRYVVNITRSGGQGIDIYGHRSDPAVVQRVEAEHAALIAKKQAAAKKYGISYDAKSEDPSPIVVDSTTKMKMIGDVAFGTPSVEAVTMAMGAEQYRPFDIAAHVASYQSAKILGSYQPLLQFDNSLQYMKDGKEKIASVADMQSRMQEFGEQDTQLRVLEDSLTKPFVSNVAYDPASGEIPVVIPYGDAEKLLGLKKFDAAATNQQKLDRIQEVRHRVGEITAAFCYRNAASQSMLAQAVAQKKEIFDNKSNIDYKKPSLLYAVPSETECGAVAVQSDTRTVAEKKAAENQKNYEKEIGTYIGEPEQHKLVVRGVGVSADFGQGDTSFSVAQIIQGLFSSSLGYNSWNIPSDLLAKVPETARPAAIFSLDKKAATQSGFYSYESFLVEFADKSEARELLSKSGFFGAGESGGVFAQPFGSSSLVLEEMQSWFEKALVWAVGIISVIAVIILSGMIGRTIADGRKESAVFRAIGARRGDIASIYSVYTLLLSLRIALFAGFFGVALAAILDVLWSNDATIGAQLAFGASNPNLEFHFLGFASWYLAAIVAIIIGVGLLSMVIPLLRNIRRSPINDMRDDS